MIATSTHRALTALAGCVLLAGCGPAAATAGAPKPTGTTVPTATAPTATAPAVIGGGGGLTACDLVTEQEATAAIGHASGPGQSGGTAALSECIYDDGGLIISMKTDAKALFDKASTDALARGGTAVPGVGDSAFAACPPANNCTMELLKGTTLVSILFSGDNARPTTIAIAKIAAAKL